MLRAKVMAHITLDKSLKSQLPAILKAKKEADDTEYDLELIAAPDASAVARKLFIVENDDEDEESIDAATVKALMICLKIQNYHEKNANQEQVAKYTYTELMGELEGNIFTRNWGKFAAFVGIPTALVGGGLGALILTGFAASWLGGPIGAGAYIAIVMGVFAVSALISYLAIEEHETSKLVAQDDEILKKIDAVDAEIKAQQAVKSSGSVIKALLQEDRNELKPKDASVVPAAQASEVVPVAPPQAQAPLEQGFTGAEDDSSKPCDIYDPQAQAAQVAVSKTSPTT